MHKIFLINMPFANVFLPSIGLTQLKSVVDSTFNEQVSVEIVYLNQDFVRYMGAGKHLREIVGGRNSHTSGIGDWFFRQSAFPEQKDNSEAYFRRYYPQPDKETQDFIRFLNEKREKLDDFLDSEIQKYGMADALVVGFTSMFSQTGACLAMAKRLKNINPNIITVMGGANCEAPMGKEIVRNVKQIDYIFSGHALKSFPQFLKHCMDQEFDKCHSIHGVFSKKNLASNKALVTIGQCAPVRDFGEELDINIKVPLDYDAFISTFKKNFPKLHSKLTLTFETSRGCWWGQRSHCTFCGLNGSGMAYRSMNADLALEQFKDIFKYADDCSIYQCVDNILPKNYLKEVLPYVEAPPNATIFYEVKADLQEDDVRVLAKARVKEIQPGIESLATSTLKLMKKGTTSFHNLALLKHCISYNIQPAWNLLIGFPGEGGEVYEKYVRDLPRLQHLFPPSGSFPVRFDRYSPYFNKAEEYGLNLVPMDFYSFVYPFDKESITNLAYYFTDTNIAADYSTTMIRWYGKIQERIGAWIDKWNNPTEKVPPQLYFKQNGHGTVIYDTRSENAEEHKLSPVAIEILKSSEKPRFPSAIHVADVPDAEIEKEIANLDERGLIFWEDNRFINLVLPGPPPANSGAEGQFHNF